MSVIVTDLNVPKSCGGCEYENCTKWRERNWGLKPPEDCPIKSVDGLINALKKHFSDEEEICVESGAYWKHEDVIDVIREYCK